MTEVASLAVDAVDVQAVLEDLRALTVRFPVGAIRTVQSHRDLFIPHLIQSIEQACDRWDAGEPQEEGQVAFFSLFLLTEFSVLEAWPTFRRVLHLKNDGPGALYGDALTETFCRMLPVYAQGKSDILDELIVDSDVELFVRSSAASAYLYLVRDQHLTREQAVDALRQHLRNGLEREDIDLCTEVGCELLEYWPIEAQSEIDTAFRKDVIDQGVFNEQDLRRALREGMAGFQQNLLRLPPTGIPNTVEELESWAGFREPEEHIPRRSWPEVYPPAAPVPEPFIHQLERQMGTLRNTERKVGRNEPCPCGSGAKYKRCCGKS